MIYIIEIPIIHIFFRPTNITFTFIWNIYSKNMIFYAKSSDKVFRVIVKKSQNHFISTN